MSDGIDTIFDLTTTVDDPEGIAEREAIMAVEAEAEAEAASQPAILPPASNAPDGGHGDLVPTVRPVKYSDDALAEEFSKLYEKDFVYVDQWGWLQWSGARWQRVPDVVVMGFARHICRTQSDICRVDPDFKNPATAESLARYIASAKVVAAVVKLASGDSRHIRQIADFDKDLWLFNTPGGTINLRTGQLRPHQRTDYITKIANATPQGECPRWRQSLSRITNENADVQDYLQRLFGYALAGDPSEECVDFFYGLGGNGKGTILDAVQHAFGEYATTASAETFLESKGERHPTDVAKLAGARLVVAQEVDKGRFWNESLLKTMTGRDRMTARFMRRDFFDFKPQFTLIISGNHKPQLKSVDAAWRRRLHLVPFDVAIPLDEQNPELKNELATEADGILKWCVEGCLLWQIQRLNPPETVLAATTDYFDAEDTFEIWLIECCIRGHHGYEERASLLHACYCRWKLARKESAAGSKTFHHELERRGFRPSRNMTGRFFSGLRLTDAERQATEAAIENARRKEQGEGL